ncbi:MAG: phage major capsid protein [Candidatus Nomurabacteria bacterium]|nr:phage major capsid protein [Candidatus Nomurabacteria bacterium]MCX6788452.1 phage major capsid protein [Candidatus Jorgensenbacteria bacterium]
MNEEQLKAIEAKFREVVDEAFEKKIGEAVGPMVAKETRSIVEKMRIERSLFGSDVSGLTNDQKTNFAEIAKAVGFGDKAKAGALTEEQDSAGGYLVETEVAAAIVRIAATVGLVLAQATKWPMTTDELGIPAFTGAFLEGEYLGYDAAGSITAMTFGQVALIAKKWQLAFALGNDLLSDASVNLADWLLALAGEALANRTDKEGFIGGGFAGSPFVGIMNHPTVTVQTMATGKTTFALFDIAEASDAIANLEESLLDGAAFYFNRTVWAKIRSQKDTAGNYIFGYYNTDFVSFGVGSGLKPQGFILGYPVYTTRHLPANSASAISTTFAIFGNIKALAYGDKGEMKVAQYQSGTFGGKEIALSDQTGLVIKHRHAVVVTLGAAFVLLKTSAS